MTIDGKSIAQSVYEKLARAIAVFPRPPRVDIVIVGDNPVVESFVRIKKSAAQRLNIVMIEHRFSDVVPEDALKEEIRKIAGLEESDGLLVQLPLPEKMNVQVILDVVPVEKDVDVLSTHAVALFADEKSKIIPPVAGAVKEILDSCNMHVVGKEVLVLGFGRLVGKPVSILMRHNGAHVTVIDRPVPNLAQLVKESDVVISGVGSPKLITRAMVLPMHVLIDAGTSESEGKVVGDIDPDAGEIADLFTPVPGGVGPVTVAMLFKNLCMLAKERMKSE